MVSESGYQQGPLDGVRVLEIGGGVAGPFATRLLADLGAEVIKVEEPRVGDRTRRAAPQVASNKEGASKSLLFGALNWNKKSVELAISSSDSRDDFRRLVTSADIIVESLRPGSLESIDLGHETLAAWNPAVVHTSVTPFGLDGHWSEWEATDLILYAMGGLASISGNKYPRTPIKHGLDQALFVSGLNAAYVSLAVYRLAASTGIGEHIDLSMRDCVASQLVAQTGYYVFTGAVFGRHPATNDPFRGDPVKAADGYVCMQAGRSSPIGRYAEFLDLPELLTEEFSTATARLRNAHKVRSLVESRLADEGAVDLFERACRANLLCGVVQDAQQLLANRHLSDRDIWRTLPPDGSGTEYPWRYPFEMARLSATPASLRTREPELGEHTEEVLRRAERAPTPVSHDSARGDRLPMKGLRVIDLSMVVAGPYMGGLLADLGAEVIKIEGPDKLDQTRSTTYGSYIDNDPGQDPWNRGSTYHIMNRGKRSFVCDLSTDRGRALLRDLLCSADILIENFTPRVLPSWGFSREILEDLNPRLIVISNSGYGATGPWRDFRAQGTSLEVTTGLAAFTGYEDGPPAKAGQSYPDFPACWNGLVALMSALIHRDRTGRGQWIDQGMLQVVVGLLPEALLHFQVYGTEMPRMGAQDTHSIVSGVFESATADEWVAISIRDEDDVRRLNAHREFSGLALSDSSGRAAELRGALTDFAAKREMWPAAYELQKLGIPAGPVLDLEGLLADPDLLGRGFYEDIDYGEDIGIRPIIGRPYRFLTAGADGPRVMGTAAMFAADNDYVLRVLLGLDPQSVDKLYGDGIVADQPISQTLRKPWDIDTLQRDGPLARFDPDIRLRIADRRRVADELLESLAAQAGS